MNTIERLTALELISRLPDDTPLLVEEAAIFCRCSLSKMNKMRTPGYPVEGPKYSQPGKVGSRGSNQGVVYLKKDLLEWLRDNTVTDTHAAAIRKGQMFVTLQEITEERALWRSPEGLLAGIVEQTEVDVFFRRLFKWTIVWMPTIDSLECQWDVAALPEMRSLASAVIETLGGAQDKVKALAERIEIENELSDGFSEPASWRNT